MVLVDQVYALIDFLESRKELALGHLGRSNEGRCLAKRQWSECALILNSLTAGCPQKSPTEWRTFYNDYKCKLIKKIKHNKRDMSATGGGKGKPLKLTPLQERLYNILGRDLGEPLPGVRLDPLTELVQNDVEPKKDIEVKVDPITIEEPFDEPDQEIIEDSQITSKQSNNTLATRPKTIVSNHRAIRTPNSRIVNRRKRPHESVFTTLHRLENTVSNIVSSTQNNVQLKQEDEFHIFALSVAAQLRQLPLHVAIATQSTIQSTLSEARLKSIFSKTSSQNE